MFHRIQDYELISSGDRWYRPRAYGEPRPDGTWDARLVFFPIAGGTAIATAGPETTQSTWEDLVLWAAGLTRVFLEGALDRALRLAEQPPLIADLTAAEYEALADAERLDTVAEVERAAADLDEAAAEVARAEAERIREDRLAAERALAATEEAAARTAADLHEHAAREARAIAADAAERRRAARPDRAPTRRTRGGKKKR